MRVKITHPITTTGGRFEAGTITDVTDALAAEWIEKEWAIEYADDVIEVTTMSDEKRSLSKRQSLKKAR